MILRALKLLSALLVFIPAMALSAAAADKSIIVFDASGSMWAQIEGKTRIEIARETISTVLKEFPADRELGLMAYGHREKGSCSDIELVVSPAAGTAGAISDAVNKINPKGKTPLSDAVKKAAEELKFTEEKATVILVTDGLETCNADPCALGNELEKAGVDFTAHVVGFGLSAEEGKQVACLAENTGGKYIQASDAGQLTEALKTTVVVAPEPAPTPEPEPAPQPAKVEHNIIPAAVFAEGGDPITTDVYNGLVWEFYAIAGDGTRGERLTTEYDQYKGNQPAGDYILVAKAGMAQAEQKISLTDDSVAKPVIVLNAGLINVIPYASEGGEPNGDATVNYKFPGGDTTNYGPNKVVLPAGEQTITVTIGEGSVAETFTLNAGDKLEKKIVVGTGSVVANATYVEGMMVEDGGLTVEIFKAAKKIDGSRDKISYGYGANSKYELPPGDYVLSAKLAGAKGETPFTVKVGELVEPVVMLNAGVLKAVAPGNDAWRIESGKPKIDGSRDTFDYGYGPEFQTTLTAGDYVIVTRKSGSDEDKLTPVTIKAGERLEVTVE
jgi:Ca-activated chloride channel homolog